MNKKSNNKGFSLVELIIVIAIMAILVGVLAPQFIKYIESSRQSTDIQNATSLRSAIEAYVSETDPTPSGSITVTISGSNLVVAGGSITSANLESVGLSLVTPTKSSGWSNGTVVGTYNCSSFKWSSTACSNSKQPQKDLKVAFD